MSESGWSLVRLLDLQYRFLLAITCAVFSLHCFWPLYFVYCCCQERESLPSTCGGSFVNCIETKSDTCELWEDRAGSITWDGAMSYTHKLSWVWYPYVLSNHSSIFSILLITKMHFRFCSHSYKEYTAHCKLILIAMHNGNVFIGRVEGSQEIFEANNLLLIFYI